MSHEIPRQITGTPYNHMEGLKHGNAATAKGGDKWVPPKASRPTLPSSLPLPVGEKERIPS